MGMGRHKTSPGKGQQKQEERNAASRARWQDKHSTAKLYLDSRNCIDNWESALIAALVISGAIYMAWPTKCPEFVDRNDSFRMNNDRTLAGLYKNGTCDPIAPPDNIAPPGVMSNSLAVKRGEEPFLAGCSALFHRSSFISRALLKKCFKGDADCQSLVNEQDEQTKAAVASCERAGKTYRFWKGIMSNGINEASEQRQTARMDSQSQAFKKWDELAVKYGLTYRHPAILAIQNTEFYLRVAQYLIKHKADGLNAFEYTEITVANLLAQAVHDKSIQKIQIVKMTYPSGSRHSFVLVNSELRDLNVSNNSEHVATIITSAAAKTSLFCDPYDYAQHIGKYDADTIPSSRLNKEGKPHSLEIRTVPVKFDYTALPQAVRQQIKAARNQLNHELQDFSEQLRLLREQYRRQPEFTVPDELLTEKYAPLPVPEKL
jgi:hypothetical protein